MCLVRDLSTRRITFNQRDMFSREVYSDPVDPTSVEKPVLYIHQTPHVNPKSLIHLGPSEFPCLRIGRVSCFSPTPLESSITSVNTNSLVKYTSLVSPTYTVNSNSSENFSPSNSVPQLDNARVESCVSRDVSLSPASCISISPTSGVGSSSCSEFNSVVSSSDYFDISPDLPATHPADKPVSTDYSSVFSGGRNPLRREIRQQHFVVQDVCSKNRKVDLLPPDNLITSLRTPDQQRHNHDNVTGVRWTLSCLTAAIGSKSLKTAGLNTSPSKIKHKLFKQCLGQYLQFAIDQLTLSEKCELMRCLKYECYSYDIFAERSLNSKNIFHNPQGVRNIKLTISPVLNRLIELCKILSMKTLRHLIKKRRSKARKRRRCINNKYKHFRRSHYLRKTKKKGNIKYLGTETQLQLYHRYPKHNKSFHNQRYQFEDNNTNKSESTNDVKCETYDATLYFSYKSNQYPQESEKTRQSTHTQSARFQQTHASANTRKTIHIQNSALSNQRLDCTEEHPDENQSNSDLPPLNVKPDNQTPMLLRRKRRPPSERERLKSSNKPQPQLGVIPRRSSLSEKYEFNGRLDYSKKPVTNEKTYSIDDIKRKRSSSNAILANNSSFDYSKRPVLKEKTSNIYDVTTKLSSSNAILANIKRRPMIHSPGSHSKEITEELSGSTVHSELNTSRPMLRSRSVSSILQRIESLYERNNLAVSDLKSVHEEKPKSYPNIVGMISSRKLSDDIKPRLETRQPKNRLQSDSKLFGNSMIEQTSGKVNLYPIPRLNLTHEGYLKSTRERLEIDRTQFKNNVVSLKGDESSRNLDTSKVQNKIKDLLTGVVDPGGQTDINQLIKDGDKIHPRELNHSTRTNTLVSSKENALPYRVNEKYASVLNAPLGYDKSSVFKSSGHDKQSLDGSPNSSTTVALDKRRKLLLSNTEIISVDSESFQDNTDKLAENAQSQNDVLEEQRKINNACSKKYSITTDVFTTKPKHSGTQTDKHSTVSQFKAKYHRVGTPSSLVFTKTETWSTTQKENNTKINKELYREPSYESKMSQTIFNDTTLKANRGFVNMTREGSIKHIDNSEISLFQKHIADENIRNQDSEENDKLHDTSQTAAIETRTNRPDSRTGHNSSETYTTEGKTSASGAGINSDNYLMRSSKSGTSPVTPSITSSEFYEFIFPDEKIKVRPSDVRYITNAPRGVRRLEYTPHEVRVVRHAGKYQQSPPQFNKHLRTPSQRRTSPDQVPALHDTREQIWSWMGRPDESYKFENINAHKGGDSEDNQNDNGKIKSSPGPSVSSTPVHRNTNVSKKKKSKTNLSKSKSKTSQGKEGKGKKGKSKDPSAVPSEERISKLEKKLEKVKSKDLDPSESQTKINKLEKKISKEKRKSVASLGSKKSKTGSLHKGASEVSFDTKQGNPKKDKKKNKKEKGELQNETNQDPNTNVRDTSALDDGGANIIYSGSQTQMKKSKSKSSSVGKEKKSKSEKDPGPKTPNIPNTPNIPRSNPNPMNFGPQKDPSSYSAQRVSDICDDILKRKQGKGVSNTCPDPCTWLKSQNMPGTGSAGMTGSYLQKLGTSGRTRLGLNDGKFTGPIKQDAPKVNCDSILKRNSHFRQLQDTLANCSGITTYTDKCQQKCSGLSERRCPTVPPCPDHQENACKATRFYAWPPMFCGSQEDAAWAEDMMRKGAQGTNHTAHQRIRNMYENQPCRLTKEDLECCPCDQDNCENNYVLNSFHGISSNCCDVAKNARHVYLQDKQLVVNSRNRTGVEKVGLDGRVRCSAGRGNIHVSLKSYKGDLA